MTSPEELREEAQSVSWWLSPENAEARRQLAERRPELELWLQKVEAMVKAKLAERSAQVEQEGSVKV